MIRSCLSALWCWVFWAAGFFLGLVARRDWILDGQPWSLGLALISVGLLEWGAIVYAEHYLAGEFGKTYTAYQRRVRR